MVWLKSMMTVNAALDSAKNQSSPQLTGDIQETYGTHVLYPSDGVLSCFWDTVQTFKTPEVRDVFV